MRPAFGRPVVPSWVPITSQGWGTTGEVRTGERPGELLLLRCGQDGGIHGWKCREELPGGQRVGDPQTVGRSKGTQSECREET